MTPETTVSIVIPAYNHANYLVEAIESVMAQDYPCVELIVVDDGSTDGTRGVLESYGDRFTWWSHENMGQAATLNSGWRRAQGEVIGYLSADDRLGPGAVRCALEVLSASPDVLVAYCDYELIDAQSRPIRTVRTREFDYDRMVDEVDCLIGPGAFFRKSVFAELGGWSTDFRQSPDLDFWLRAGGLGRFQRIPKVLAGFRVHESSQSFAVADVARAEEAVVIVERLFASQKMPARLVSRRRRALAFAHLRAARHHLRAGRYQLAMVRTGKAVRSSPTSLLTRRAVRLMLNAALNRAGHRVLWWLGREDRL